MPICRSQDGGLLLEALIAGAILAVAVVGLALMFSEARTYLLAEGNDRVTLFLAQQKIESLRAREFDDLAIGNPATTAGCPNGEPCYNEVLQAGEGGAQTFTRLTCVNHVLDANPTSPGDCSSCTVGPGCQFTKRMRVTVTPAMAKGETVVLETVVTKNP